MDQFYVIPKVLERDHDHLQQFIPAHRVPSKAVSIPVEQYLAIQKTERWKALNGDIIKICEDKRAAARK
jgi:hypothetical protein